MIIIIKARQAFLAEGDAEFPRAPGDGIPAALFAHLARLVGLVDEVIAVQRGVGELSLLGNDLNPDDVPGQEAHGRTIAASR